MKHGLQPQGYVFVGLIAAVVVAFIAIQVLSWRSSKAVVGAGRALALTTIALVLSDALAYGVVSLAQAGWVPEFVGKFPLMCAFVWFSLALWPIFLLGIVELVLVLELPVVRKCRTPVQMIHVGALGASWIWLGTLVLIDRLSVK